MNDKKVNIWLDCDVGNEDSVMALILSLFDPKANLVAISSSYGNNSLENCTNNTLKLLTTIDCTHIPVLKGANRPLKQHLMKTDMQEALDLFGSEILPKKFEAIDNVSHYELIQKLFGDQKFTLVITGPQTNTAKLLQSHPEVLSQITEIVFMGGTSGFGNITPSAEFNIYSDPEAAQFVLDTCKQHKVKLTMIALDLTNTCLIYEDIEQKIKDINSKFSEWVVRMLQEQRNASRKQDLEYSALHEPIAVFYALYPEYFITKPYYVAVDCQSSLSYGRTLVDKHHVYGLEPNVEFGVQVQVNKFWDHIIEAVKQASKKSQIEQNKEKTNIWLDCDVGNDDAMAILMALFHPKSNLVGVSTSFGNTSLKNATENTLRVLSTLGFTNIPVYKGSRCSLRQVEAETEFHGKQGLFGVERLIKSYEATEDGSLYEFMSKHLKGQKVTIVITGPQTNIAKLLKDHPEIINQINEIVFMGGASGFGNVTPNAEYNIHCDPQAAQQVIDICKEHKLKLVMIPLDVTHTCLVDQQIQDKIQGMNTKFTDWCLDMLKEFQEAYRAEEFDYPPLHDPVAIFYALNPEEFVTKPYYVVVAECECQSHLCYGRTVVDKLGSLKREPTIVFAKKVNVDNFWNHMLAAVSQAAKHSLIE